VTSAELNPADSTASSVLLTVSPAIDYNSTLTVNGVGESIQNIYVAANSQANIPVLYNIPNGFGVSTHATVVNLNTNVLDPHWLSTLAYYFPESSNYYMQTCFDQSNGVLHCHGDDTNQDGNFLIWYDPVYSNNTEEILEHFTIVNANYTGGGIAGAATGIQPNCLDYAPNGAPAGGETYRTVNAGYAGGPSSYAFFLWASDFVADELFNTRYQSWQVGNSYWVRVREDQDPVSPGTGVIVSCKAWLGDGSVPEPANWDISRKDSYSDGTPLGVDRYGFCAVRAGYNVNQVNDFDVDYVQITSSKLPSVTPALPAALIPRIGLNVAASGGNTICSWPAAAPVSYTLQSAPAPFGPWSNVGTAPVVNGPVESVTIPSTDTQFFRLIQ
jgi:hypothetical protein